MSRVNLFIIGVKKAGTSWLYHLLDSHPAICMCAEKELYYFGNLYPNLLDRYHDHFPFGSVHRYYGEATPDYFREPGVAGEIAQYNPEAKLLAIVRDPIVRLQSEFTYQKQLGNLPEGLTTTDLMGPEVAELRTISHYEETLPAFQHRFGEGQLMIISMEDAVEHVETTWSAIQDFLGIAQTSAPKKDARYRNPTGSTAFRKVYRALVRPIKKRSPRLYRAMLRSQAATVLKKITLSALGTARRGPLPDDVHAQLIDEFAPTYQYLREMGFERYGLRRRRHERPSRSSVAP